MCLVRGALAPSHYVALDRCAPRRTHSLVVSAPRLLRRRFSPFPLSPKYMGRCSLACPCTPVLRRPRAGVRHLTDLVNQRLWFTFQWRGVPIPGSLAIDLFGRRTRPKRIDSPR